MKVKNMEWKDMEQMVTRRLNSLAMCKRGSIESEFNKRKEALGELPRQSAKEKQQDRKANATALKKALTPTIKECTDLDFYALRAKIQERAQEVVDQSKKEYPPAAKYRKAMDRLKDEKQGRMATLDSDFMDVGDNFKLGITQVTEFPTVYDKLEAKEW